jgi:thiamine-phosphate pyrophosphorylase
MSDPPMRPRLIAITDQGVAPRPRLEARLERLCALAAPGSVLVQLRDLEMPARARLELARRLRQITTSYAQFLAINDRADLAMLVEADGLHVGERGLLPHDARRIVGARFVSRACHDPLRAESLGADAVVLSPILAPRKGRPALGLDALRAARRASERERVRPLLFALGGIDAATAAGVLAAGADGIAAISAILTVDDPRPLLEALGILSCSPAGPRPP